MNRNLRENISKCQNDLLDKGYCLTKIPLPEEVARYVKQKDYNSLDASFLKYTAPDGFLFEYLKNYLNFHKIEFIISLREATNEWEGDGIWHDDGSRALAFSLSLTLDEVCGGHLGIRKKMEETFTSIPTPEYGTMIIFKTGRDDYEHKIHAVTKGSRLIIAGWCYDSNSDSIL